MTRAEQIFSLKRRYHALTQARQWKESGVVYARLRDLVTKQLKYENRRQ